MNPSSANAESNAWNTRAILRQRLACLKRLSDLISSPLSIDPTELAVAIAVVENRLNSDPWTGLFEDDITLWEPEWASKLQGDPIVGYHAGCPMCEQIQAGFQAARAVIL